MTGPVRSLFDAPLAVAEGDPRSFEPEPLPGAEAAIVASAGRERQAQFGAGRRLARAALGEFGIDRFQLLRDINGAPLWPPGIVGSISHCPCWACAVVAPTSAAASLGCDVELDSPLAPADWTAFCSPGELEALERRGAGEAAREAKVVFSAKETVAKAVYGSEGWLPVARAVTITLDGDRFRATTLDGRVEVAGRWCRVAGLVATGVVIPQD